MHSKKAYAFFFIEFSTVWRSCFFGDKTALSIKVIKITDFHRKNLQNILYKIIKIELKTYFAEKGDKK